MPSTTNLSDLPDIDNLKMLCKSISTLDAIICPDWQYRYYSYQNNWDTALGEECMSMRNGSGDEFSILFSQSGAIINGLGHESEMSRWSEVAVKSKNIFQNIFGKKQTEFKQDIWPGVVDKVPIEFQHFIFGEPIKSKGTTFCIWRKYTDHKWNIGDIAFPNDDYKDGSEHLLFILDNNPQTYHTWAIDYYDDNFEGNPNKLDLDLVKYIYENRNLTKDIAFKINSNVEDFEKLKSDVNEIGYPNDL